MAPQNEQQDKTSPPDAPEEKDEKDEHQPSLPKRVAEAFTLGLSLLIVGGLALYLALQARRPTSDFVEVRSRVMWEDAQRKGGRTILPIEIENRGSATLSEVQLRVSFQQDGREQEREVMFDYVAGGSKRTAYLLFKPEIAALKRYSKVEAEASFYQVD